MGTILLRIVAVTCENKLPACLCWCNGCAYSAGVVAVGMHVCESAFVTAKLAAAGCQGAWPGKVVG